LLFSQRWVHYMHSNVTVHSDIRSIAATIMGSSHIPQAEHCSYTG
jgi:hypothetical protein